LLIEEDIFDFSSEPEPKKEAPKVQKPLQKREEVRGVQGPGKKSWQKPKIFVAGLGWVEEDKIDADGHVFEEELLRILEEAKATNTTTTTSTKSVTTVTAPLKGAPPLKILKTTPVSTNGATKVATPMTAKIKPGQKTFVDLT